MVRLRKGREWVIASRDSVLCFVLFQSLGLAPCLAACRACASRLALRLAVRVPRAAVRAVHAWSTRSRVEGGMPSNGDNEVGEGRRVSKQRRALHQLIAKVYTISFMSAPPTALY